MRSILPAAVLHIVFTAILAGQPLAAGRAGDGKVLAMQWCAQCHVVADDQTTASADAPTFKAIAQQYRANISVLEAFLVDPHPPMPDMSLTRQEIQDLIAYIGSLR